VQTFADEIIKKVCLAAGDYEVRLGEHGVEIRRDGEDWPPQVLLYDNLRILLADKNKAFSGPGTFADKQRAWQEMTIAKIQKALNK